MSQCIHGTFFNVSRATVRNNRSNIYLLSFHDDDYFIRLPEDIFQAVDNFDICMEPLALSRNRYKCQLYDPWKIAGSEKGIIVCGAPVGSIQFLRQYVNSKVDSTISQQLDDLMVF